MRENAKKWLLILWLVMNPIYYLYKEGSKYPVKNGDLTNETGGEFCTQMKLPNNNLSGNYTVKVLYFRNVISLVAFRIP